MTTTDVVDDTTPTTATGAPRPTRLRTVLLGVIAVAVLAVAVSGGYFWGNRSSGGAAKPTATDIGFARDMAAHHQQAVTMAAYVRDTSTDPEIVTLAYDIESSQTTQIGEMTGWLDTWNLTLYDAHPMQWMGPAHASHVVNGLMPGMATPTQMNKLLSLHGKALDKYFLQLMIHHHQGGLPMAQLAEQEASEPYIRTVAGHIAASQGAEILTMEQMLRQRGGAPLAPPQT